MASLRKIGTLRKQKKVVTETLKEEDEVTNEMLRRRRSKQFFATLKVIATIERHKSKYQTARGRGFLWTEDDENKHEVRVFIRDAEALRDDQKWEQLISKGVTNLIIEDNENKLKKIPPQLVNIPTLRSLTLLCSKINCIPPNTLPAHLKQLSLQKCPLKNVSSIEQLSDLVSLELIDDGLKVIPMEIGEMTNLRSLDLTGNHLKSLPDSLSNLCQLSVLKVSGNNLAEFPNCITELTSLETIDFSHNHITEISSSIGRLVNLVTLRISHNQIQALPASFRRLEKLRHVYLSHNKFAAVPEIFGDLAGLQTLNIISNKVETMQRPIRSLTTLLLDKNNLEELPLAIFHCQLLEKLSVQHNQLASIPPQIALLERLRALYIGGNPFTKLPDDICALSELRHLVIRETKVKDLPIFFDKLERLSVVDVEETALDETLIHAAKKNGVSGLMDKIQTRRDVTADDQTTDNKDPHSGSDPRDTSSSQESQNNGGSNSKPIIGTRTTLMPDSARDAEGSPTPDSGQNNGNTSHAESTLSRQDPEEIRERRLNKQTISPLDNRPITLLPPKV